MPTRMARSPITSSECGAHDATRATPSHFLTIDIGGSGLKAAVVDRKGQMIGDRVRVKTPHPCPPDVLLGRLLKLVAPLAPFDCVAVGFPGVVRDGTVVGLRLDGDTTVVSNKLGVKGGLALWLGKSGGRAGRAAPPIQGFGST